MNANEYLFVGSDHRTGLGQLAHYFNGIRNVIDMTPDEMVQTGQLMASTGHILQMAGKEIATAKEQESK